MIAPTDDRRRANINNDERKAFRRKTVDRRRRTKLRVLARDGWRCQFCGQDLGRDVGAFLTATVDHLLPRCDGGGNAEDNLLACCSACNGLKAGLSGLTVAEIRRVVARRRAHLIGRMVAELLDMGIAIPAGILPKATPGELSV